MALPDVVYPEENAVITTAPTSLVALTDATPAVPFCALVTPMLTLLLVVRVA
jgi:hypothetical protein